jgi:hypothetical protein
MGRAGSKGWDPGDCGDASDLIEGPSVSGLMAGEAKRIP